MPAPLLAAMAGLGLLCSFLAASSAVPPGPSPGVAAGQVTADGAVRTPQAALVPRALSRPAAGLPGPAYPPVPRVTDPHPVPADRHLLLRSLGPPPGPVVYAPPVEVAVVVRSFDPPTSRWTGGHRGVDLRADVATSVLAPASGVVTFAGTVVDRPVLVLTHPDGRRSSLEPVETDLVLGAAVAAGQSVGTMAPGRSHCAPTTCLHWGVRVGATYVDPLTLLPGGGPTVLLPVP